MKKLFWLLPLGLFAAVFAGQAVRLTFGNNIHEAVSLLNIFLGIVNAVALIWLLARCQLRELFRLIWRSPIWKWLLLFEAWALISLILNFGSFTHHQLVVGFLYWLKLATVLHLAYLVYAYWQEEKATFLRYFLVCSGAIILAGYVQLIFLPDFSFMTAYGWDPHMGRMLSTFFDPNYLAAFIVLVQTIILSKALEAQGKVKFFWWLFFVGAWLALYFTYSRSGWLMGFVALTAVAFQRSWRTSLVIAAIFLVVLLFPNRLSGRISEGLSFFNRTTFSQGATNNTSLNALSGDESAADRALSLGRAWSLSKRHWLIGVGYNTYGYAAIKDGLMTGSQQGQMSGMASDSSILNIFATTGIIGLGIYLAFYASLLRISYKLWRRRQLLGGVIFGYALALLVGSEFNNILFYGLIMACFLVLAALMKGHADRDEETQSTSRQQPADNASPTSIPSSSVASNIVEQDDHRRLWQNYPLIIISLFVLSLFFSTIKIGFGSLFAYPPELLIYLAAVAVLTAPAWRQKFFSRLKQLPKAYKIALG
ncbi:MAG TPA: O-antigen ligase family protein, partial [Candidatus Saccharimonadales bacterium]|nr:O-antigen ligase family protein [Candidatus Saccharimonadales bacterium]